MTDLLLPPIPVPDPDTAPYWEGLKNGKLMLCRCDDTGKWIHPPLERSRFTGGTVHFEEVSGEGTIFSYIVVRQALVGGRIPPFVIALVELEEQSGPRINAVIDCDPADVRIGQRVEPRIVELGESGYWIPEFIVKQTA
ncbi:MAG: OB-fold domain-containing protein [Mycobacterium sp.]